MQCYKGLGFLLHQYLFHQAPEFFIPVTLDVQSFTVYFKMGVLGKEEHKGKPGREAKKNRAMKQLSSSIGNSFLTNKVSSHAHTVRVEINLPDKLLPQTSSFIISLDNYAYIFFFRSDL